MNVKTRREFWEQYRPYNTMREFSEGIMAYMAGNSRNPYRAGSVQAQAWDCGFDCSYRVEHQEGGVGQEGARD
jgi:hypothetical protein